jgi:hypothetical protein
VAFYVALYAVGFLGSSLHNLSGFLPMLTYLSYMSIMILALYTAMGTVRNQCFDLACLCVAAVFEVLCRFTKPVDADLCSLVQQGTWH